MALDERLILKGCTAMNIEDDAFGIYMSKREVDNRRAIDEQAARALVVRNARDEYDEHTLLQALGLIRDQR